MSTMKLETLEIENQILALQWNLGELIQKGQQDLQKLNPNSKAVSADAETVVSQMQAALSTLQNQISAKPATTYDKPRQTVIVLEGLSALIGKVNAATNVANEMDKLVNAAKVTKPVTTTSIEFVASLLGFQPLSFIALLIGPPQQQSLLINAITPLLAKNKKLVADTNAANELNEANQLKLISRITETVSAIQTTVTQINELDELMKTLAAIKEEPIKEVEVVPNTTVIKSTDPVIESKDDSVKSGEVTVEPAIDTAVKERCAHLLKQIESTGLGANDKQMKAYLKVQQEKIPTSELVAQLNNTLVSLQSKELKLVKESIAHFTKSGKSDKTKETKGLKITAALVNFPVELRGTVMTGPINDVQKELAHHRHGDNKHTFFHKDHAAINRKEAANAYKHIMHELDKDHTTKATQ